MSTFVNADRYLRETEEKSKKKPHAWKRENKEIIRELWKRIGFIKVYCPHCNFVQECQTINEHKCINCERRFKVMPERQPSRIVEAPRGTAPLIRNIYSLTKYKKFTW